jgi:hypothetical protein
MQNLVTAIEFASSGIRLVSGYCFHGKVYVTGALEGDALPLDKDGRLAKKETEQSLAILLSAAKKQGTKEIGALIVCLPPDGFVVKSGDGRSTTVDPESRIDKIDFTNCVNMINKEVKADGKTVVFDDPFSFTDDNKHSYQTFPIGVKSDQLLVSADAEMIDSDSYQHYQQILQDLSLSPYLRLVSPMCGTSFINAFNAPESYLALDIEKDFSYLSYVQDKRLLDSKTLKGGVSMALSQASALLSVSPERASEFLNLYGFAADAGFGYFTDEKKTLKDIAAAFRAGFDPLRKDIQDFAQEKGVTAEQPLILFGPGSDIQGLDRFLTESLSRNVIIFTSKIIGARNKVFLNCLGAIRVTSNAYLGEVASARRRESDDAMKKSSFSRN